tara:strand:+ start:866 stop:1189 length:324 start_codon:yes stop_codon:yes gene_type:complete
VLNYDLGIRGNYDKLYAFLDNQDALDCGNANCAFQFDFRGSALNHNDKFKQLEEELEKTMTFEKKDRIYVIVYNTEGEPRGKFLFGQRKTPIWDGYGTKEQDDDLPF